MTRQRTATGARWGPSPDPHTTRTRHETHPAPAHEPQRRLRRHRGLPGAARPVHRARDRQLRDHRRGAGARHLWRAHQAAGVAGVLRGGDARALAELRPAGGRPAGAAHDAAAEDRAAAGRRHRGDPFRPLRRRRQHGRDARGPGAGVGHGHPERGAPHPPGQRAADHADDRHHHAGDGRPGRPAARVPRSSTRGGTCGASPCRRCWRPCRCCSSAARARAIPSHRHPHRRPDRRRRLQRVTCRASAPSAACSAA
jgi:hypothetical protein